jgi:hypothetical protein
VRPDGRREDEETLADLDRRKAVGEEVEDLPLPARQLDARRATSGSRRRL